MLEKGGLERSTAVDLQSIRCLLSFSAKSRNKFFQLLHSTSSGSCSGSHAVREMNDEMLGTLADLNRVEPDDLIGETIRHL